MSDSAAPSPHHRLAVEIEPGSSGHPELFAVAFGNERIVLAPAKSWIQLDHFKWVTRGIIEAPQSFAVHADGSVDYNGETFQPATPNAHAALTEQINKRHASGTGAIPKPTASHTRDTHSQAHPAFRVHLDHSSHILIQAFRGSERTETGLRGIAHLAADGWMRTPQSLHIDPLQRYLELDGVRFDNDASGAQSLEEFLNQHFVPPTASGSAHPIEIRENSAASTGFDIRFGIVRAGTRIEIKGHLSQEKLEILQDHAKCDLLRPDILLRISPPFLYIRRRHHDGSEEPIPELPDLKYRGVAAAELERLLNHPLIRNPATLSPTDTAILQASPASATISPQAPEPERQPPAFTPPPKSPPPRANPRPTPPTAPAADSEPHPSAAPPPPPAPTSPPPIPTPFRAGDTPKIHESIFHELTHRLHIPVQDLLLSLPRVFTDRRFEVLDFNGEEIVSVLQLRTSHFYGFYLTHLGADAVELVYACHGTHLEWGQHKCTVQPQAGAETAEFRGPALLGLAQNADHHFVFVVDPRFRNWIQPHEKTCNEAYAHFITPDVWARQRGDFPLIWPTST